VSGSIWPENRLLQHLQEERKAAIFRRRTRRVGEEHEYRDPTENPPFEENLTKPVHPSPELPLVIDEEV